MRKVFVFLFVVLLASKGWCDVEITIQRASSNVNSGFRERIFVDGKEVLVLANGASGKIRVADGNHTIHAELSTLKTDRLSFSARGGTLNFVVTAHSVKNFVIEKTGGDTTTPQAAAPSRPAALPNPGGVEGSLLAAADKIIEKFRTREKVAIVNVASRDREVGEFVANELEYILVEEGIVVIDRSQLDFLREEQNLQMSGEIDDNTAVSIGKLAGASIIITGAVTGTGDLRRLRLRALDTQTAQVMAVASERF
ncbi:hypothetical protein AGMMS49928_13370 [Spirochaetia bacterium]|nr:hypothetical protein AGMMS49928_13370 [Spirochaetia bacterium]